MVVKRSTRTESAAQRGRDLLLLLLCFTVEISHLAEGVWFVLYV